LRKERQASAERARETQADLSERFQGTIRLLRLGELRVKKRNGGLTVAEAAEKEELEEA